VMPLETLTLAPSRKRERGLSISRHLYVFTSPIGRGRAERG
jgi:hypothetical protein